MTSVQTTLKLRFLLFFFFFFFSFFLLFPVLQMVFLPNPKPFSSKPPMTLLFQTQNPKKEKRKKEKKKISYLLFHSQCLCMFPFFFSDLWFFLSLSVWVYLFPFFFSDLWFFLSLLMWVYLFPFFFSDLWFFLIYDSFFLSRCVYLFP